MSRSAGGGIVSHHGRRYWAAIAGDSSASSTTGFLPQYLYLYNADGRMDRRIVFRLDEDEVILRSHFNAAANCAVLRTETGHRRTWNANSSQIVLLDFAAALAPADLPQLIDLAQSINGGVRVRSSLERRFNGPNEVPSGLTQATCLRDSDGQVSLVYSYTTPSGAGANQVATSLQLASVDPDGNVISLELTEPTHSLKVMYPGGAADSVVAAVPAHLSARFTDIALVSISASGEVEPIPTFGERSGWQYFDEAARAGLVIPTGVNGPEPGNLAIRRCGSGTCQDYLTNIHVDFSASPMGSGFLDGRQFVRQCQRRPEGSCERIFYLFDFDLVRVRQ